MSEKSGLKTYIVKDSEGDRHIIQAKSFSTWDEDGANVYFFIDNNVIASLRNFMVVAERAP